MQAQAEHRARYPDWRFRPGTNVDALAKRKTKDKNKDRPPARRRRTTTSARDKIAAATGGGGGGGGCVRGKARGAMQERRCAQIAELLAQGVKGVALTSAVQAWDKESGVSPATDGVFVAEPGVATAKTTTRVRARAKTDPQVQDHDARGRSEMRGAKDAEVVNAKTRSVSSAQQARFNVSLTSMFRRASSVPIAPAHDSPAQSTGIWAPGNALISSVPEFSPPPLSPASSVSYCSESSFPDSDNASVSVFFPVHFVKIVHLCCSGFSFV